MPTVWQQYEIELTARPRGFHLVTDEIVRSLTDLRLIKVGFAHFFLLHTSASLTINENASPDVLADFSAFFDRLVPDATKYFTHRIEGPDDMPAHIKTSLTDSGMTVPIRGGRLALGTWQGLYLCEHRHFGGPRRLLATLNGESV